MPNSMKLLILIAWVQLIASCNPDELVPDESTANPVVWEKHIAKDAASKLAMSPLVYKSNLIVGKKKDDGYNVTSLNQVNGSITWTIILPESNNFNSSSGDEALVYGDKIILTEGPRLYVLDASTGEVKWWIAKENVRGSTCLIDNFLYKSLYVKRSHSTLFRYDIETGAEEELFTLRKGPNEPGGDFTPNICLPVKWVNKQGDEILIMQNRSYGFDRIGPDGMYGYSKMDVFAYNLTADSILWYRYELDGFSSLATPAIDGDNVYFYGDHNAYCIDAETGKTNWKFFIGDGPEDDFNTANILLVDNFLVVKPDNEHMHVVQKKNGKLVWTNKETEAMPGMITHRNDTLWFASARIYGIDLYTGKKVVEWDDGRWGDWIFPITPHPALPYIYTTDGDYVYCLDPRQM
jgi:outer membrane protein assembly factor BamB